VPSRNIRISTNGKEEAEETAEADHS